MKYAPQVSIGAPPEHIVTAAAIANDLRALLSLACDMGFVITVETVPVGPLAMGNYRIVGNVRSAR